MTYMSLRARTKDKHIDDWLMTYADMITLLLCFFVVFLISAHMDKKPAMPEVVHQSVEVHQSSALKPVEERFDLPFPVATSETEAAPSELVTQLEIHPVETLPPEPEALPEPIVVAEVSVPQPAPSVNPIADQNANGGDRITTIELESSTFFDQGSALLRSEGVAALRDVAQKIGDEKYKDYQITIEGHTDNAPIKTSQFPSNWELSTARAATVVRYFVVNGMPASRFRAAGYADSQPKAPNRDEQGHALAQNQAQNRRVVIKLEKIDKDKIAKQPS